MTSIVVAYDRERGIGANNDLLWQRDLPADLRHFKETTMGGAIIMGRLTFDSLGRKPLPGRDNIVISSSLEQGENFKVARSLDDALAMTSLKAYIIGGGSIYEQSIDVADEVIATEVQQHFPQATVFFPELPDDEWHETGRQQNFADDKNKYDYDFVTYSRK